jgi:hypothetical protein
MKGPLHKKKHSLNEVYLRGPYPEASSKRLFLLKDYFLR